MDVFRQIFDWLDFNPRSPRGERLVRFVILSDVRIISIHALREESDYDYHI